MLDEDVGAFAQLSFRLAFDSQRIGHVDFVDVVYLHGLSDGMIESCNLFGLVAEASRRADWVSFNGDPAAHAQEVGWCGAERYREELERRGVSSGAIIPTAPGLHTRSECDEFIALAKERVFKDALIVTVPYHWPRVMACLVGAMAKHNYRLRAYFVCPESVNWYEPMVGSQGTEKNSTFLNEAAGDVKRFCTYLERGRQDDGEAWKTRYGAPVGESMKYLDWRDRGI